MGYLVPGQKRRLAAEQAIYNRFPNFKECGKACNAYCKARMLNITFNDMAVHQYVGCKTNFSVPRLRRCWGSLTSFSWTRCLSPLITVVRVYLGLVSLVVRFPIWCFPSWSNKQCHSVPGIRS